MGGPDALLMWPMFLVCFRAGFYLVFLLILIQLQNILVMTAMFFWKCAGARKSSQRLEIAIVCLKEKFRETQSGFVVGGSVVELVIQMRFECRPPRALYWSTAGLQLSTSSINILQLLPPLPQPDCEKITLGPDRWPFRPTCMAISDRSIPFAQISLWKRLLDPGFFFGGGRDFHELISASFSCYLRVWSDRTETNWTDSSWSRDFFCKVLGGGVSRVGGENEAAAFFEIVPMAANVSA